MQVVQNLGRGGLEAMSVNLALALADRGVRPALVALEVGGVLEERLAAANVDYHVIGKGRYRDLRTHRELIRLFRHYAPQAVHTHHFAALAASVPAVRIAGVPRLVHTEHAYQYLEPRPVLRHSLRWLSRPTDAFVVVGASMEEYYARDVGVPRDRLRVIVNGVDTERYRPPADVRAARRRAGLPDGLLIGTAGRFAAVKNYPLLLRAVAEVRRTRPEVHLVMAGDGEEREALESLARTLGYGDGIHFLGWRTDLAEIVSCLDVFALTSWTEALPLVILEAMACAVPVAATAVGDLPHIIDDGRTGQLVPSNDVAALARALGALADEPDRRRAMGRAGHDYVLRRYSQDVMVQRYMHEYGLPTP